MYGVYGSVGVADLSRYVFRYKEQYDFLVCGNFPGNCDLFHYADFIPCGGRRGTFGYAEGCSFGTTCKEITLDVSFWYRFDWDGNTS